jgi:hypothetical protein
LSPVCEFVVFCWEKLVFLDVVDFQQPSFEAVSEVAVDFFAVEVEAAVIKLIHVAGVLSEHAEKLVGLQQIAEFGAFLWSTPHQQHQPTLRGVWGYHVFLHVRFLQALA